MTMPRWIAGLLGIVVLLVGCTPKLDTPTTSAFDGVYKGNGYSSSPAGWDCPSTMPDNTLNVSGGYATFTDLRGWVSPGGTAQLSSRIATLEGQFQESHFQGQLQYHERDSDRLTCGYQLKLQRAN
jgi:hypothetical protein